MTGWIRYPLSLVTSGKLGDPIDSVTPDARDLVSYVHAAAIKVHHFAAILSLRNDSSNLKSYLILSLATTRLHLQMQ